jgi:hypothetical protein
MVGQSGVRWTVRQIYPGGIGRIVGSATLEDEGSLIKIGVTWPATLPDEGYVTATSPSAYAEGTFDLGIPGDDPRVSVLPKDWENGAGLFGRFPAFSPGDDVVILGTGFEPNSSVPLGIYRGGMWQGMGPGRLVLAKVVNVDDQGRFTMQSMIDVSDPTDEPIDLYLVLAVTTTRDEMGCGPEENDYYWCPMGPLAWFQMEVTEGQGLTPFATSSASSYLATDSGEQYESWLATDGAFETSWVEGVPGPGIGEWFMLTFPGAVEIEDIDVDAGCDRDADGFYANNRIRRATLIFSGGEQIDVTLSDTRGMQMISLAQVAGSDIETTFVKLVIEEVYPGSEYNDTCLAEIAVWGIMR